MKSPKNSEPINLNRYHDIKSSQNVDIPQK